MKQMRVLTILTVVAALAIPVASAQTLNIFTPQPASTAWNATANWSLNVIPNFGHDVLIESGDTCIILLADGVANTIEIESGATLGVTDGKSLTVDSANAAGSIDSVLVAGELFLREDDEQNPGELLFKSGAGGLKFLITGGGLVTAASATEDGPGRIARDGASATTVQITSGTTIKGELEFNNLIIDNDGLILVDGSDTLTIGASIGSPAFSGSGTYKVNGASATMTFTDGNVSGSGKYEVINGTMALDDLQNPPVLGSHTITIDGGVFTSDSNMRLEGSDVTIDNDGSMEITGNLVVQENGAIAGTVTIEDGTLDVSGQLRVRESTVTVKAGLLDTNTVDADCSTLTIQGGTFKVAGTFFSDVNTLTLSGGELELNGAFTGLAGTLTITGGTLDVNEDFTNTGFFTTTFKNATITVAANKTATFE